MATWDAVATVKAPIEQVLAYVAHNLSLGVSHIWLYFDDPETPVPDLLGGHPKVTVMLCDDRYWKSRGKRHDKHQSRQSRNARDAYGRTQSQWLTHIDVDEFILADKPVDRILEAVPADVRVVKLEPFEAMHDPGLPDDIFTARSFRGPLRKDFADLRPLALGEYEHLLPQAMLSHSVGKVFFRTGIPGLSPRLHGAMLDGERVPSSERNPDMRVLHFHAQDREAWLAALPFRLTRGAYQFYPEMQAFLMEATAQEIDRFYFRTQTVSGAAFATLEDRGRLVQADLGLRRKVQDLLEGRFGKSGSCSI